MCIHMVIYSLHMYIQTHVCLCRLLYILYTHMCVYMSARTHVHTCAYRCTHVYVSCAPECICMYECVCVHTHMCVHVYTRMDRHVCALHYVHMSTNGHVCLLKGLYVCVKVHSCIHMCAFTCAYFICSVRMCVCIAHMHVYTHKCTYIGNDQHFTESDVHRQYLNKASGFPKWMHKLTHSQPHMSLFEIPHPSQHVAFSGLNHHQSDECVIIHCCS